MRSQGRNIGMLTKQKIEQKLRLPLLNVCLAVAAGRENDLREAKSALIDAIHALLSRAG